MLLEVLCQGYDYYSKSFSKISRERPLEEFLFAWKGLSSIKALRQSSRTRQLTYRIENLAPLRLGSETLFPTLKTQDRKLRSESQVTI